MLRLCIWIAAALLVAGGVVLMFVPHLWPAGVEMAIFGALVVLSLTVERHYRGLSSRNVSGWQPTGERFIDPGTGKLVEVEYDSKTGERKYRQM